MSFFWRRAGSSSEPAPRETARRSWERRAAYRAPVNLPVTFTAAPGADARSGQLVDISAAGARLIATDELVLGGKITLSVAFPNEFLDELDDEEERRVWLGGNAQPGVVPPPFHPLALEGAVVTGQYDPRHRYHVYGVNFEQRDTAVSEELYRFIALWQRHKLRILRRR